METTHFKSDKHYPYVKGFTLVELLVAVAVTSLISAAAFVSIQAATVSRDVSKGQAETLREIQYALTLLGQDISQIALKPIRAQYDDYQPSVAGNNTSDESLLALSRYQNLSILSTKKSNLRRVSYGLVDGVLVRKSWPAFNADSDSEPIVNHLVQQVEAFRARYLKQGSQRLSDSHSWLEYWPVNNADLFSAPDAIEVTIELKGWGVMKRVFLVTAGAH